MSLHIDTSDATYSAVGATLGFTMVKLMYYAEVAVAGVISGAFGAIGAFLIKRFIIDRFFKSKKKSDS